MGRIRPYIIVLFSSYFVSVLLNNVYGKNFENYVFNHENISKVELEIALYDLKINHLNVWDINKIHPYIDGIATCAWGNSKLHMNVFVTDSIMKGTINDSKQRIQNLCSFLFEIAKNHFNLKSDTDPKEGCYSCLTPRHINMDIHLRKLGSNSVIIAEYRGGKILYTDAFLK